MDYVKLRSWDTEQEKESLRSAQFTLNIFFSAGSLQAHPFFIVEISRKLFYIKQL